MITTLNNSVAQKPSIVDAIIKQGVSTAPIIQMIGTGTLTAPSHSWINDRYADAKDNANLELSDLNENTTPTKVKNSNHAQIVINEIGVTKRQMEMSQYGEKEWAYQVGKKGKEHLKDVEYALLGLGHTGGVESAPVVATPTVAPRMAGFFYFVPNEQRYVVDGYDPMDVASHKDLTMDELHYFLEPMWKRGAMEDDTFTVLLGSKLKNKVNNFAKDYIIKNSGVHKFDPTITEIVTDFGTVKFQLHRHFAGDALADKMLAGKFKEARAMYVTKTEFKDVPTSKTAKFGRYYTDLSLEIKNGDMFASGKGWK
jgi:hypothetical protein